MKSHVTRPTSVALDSNVLLPIFRDYDRDVYQRVAEGRLRVYIPVIVYAEQAIYPKEPVDNVVDALHAQVISLDINHARRLGRLWPTIPDPDRGLRKRDLWLRHRFDWLIVAMALQEGWAVVTQDKGPAFHAPGLRVLTVSEFASRFLGEKP